jgi:D-glycerate 3-kinase
MRIAGTDKCSNGATATRLHNKSGATALRRNQSHQIHARATNPQVRMREQDIALRALLIYRHIVAHVPVPHPSCLHSSSPLFVALQGPQGSGKTVVTEHIRSLLTRGTDEEHGAFKVATLSIDDLYLPHAQLKALASAHPENPLLQGRGHPGTHDTALGLSLLRSLKDINRSPTDHLRIPRFDKSLFNGEGDRLPESEWTSIHGPLDIVLLEGWCVGFYAQSRQYLEQRMNEVPFGLDGMFDHSVYTLEHIIDVNQRLAEYSKWWDLFDICAQVCNYLFRNCFVCYICGVEKLDFPSRHKSLCAHI